MAAKHQPRPEHGSNGQASHDRDASLLRPRVRQAENRAGKDGVGRDDHDASHPPYTAVTVSKRKYHRGKADVPHGSQDRLARWPASPINAAGMSRPITTFRVLLFRAVLKVAAPRPRAAR